MVKRCSKGKTRRGCSGKKLKVCKKNTKCKTKKGKGRPRKSRGRGRPKKKRVSPCAGKSENA